MIRRYLLAIFLALLIPVLALSTVINTDVLVVGGGCGGSAAAVQAARMGCRVVLVDETPWLGGMISSAGVSCIDGNSGTLETGLFRDICTTISNYYGSVASTGTGAWVSNFCFEPKAGNYAWQLMVSTTGNISTYFNSTCIQVLVTDSTVSGAVIVTSAGDTVEIRAHVTLDGTEYGDLLPLAGIPYKLGRDSQADYGEYAAPTTADGLVQDITYCAILKNYGTPTTIIPVPPGYSPDNYNGSMLETCSNLSVHLHTVYPYAQTMSYGQLQNQKYMINWPIHGNDWDEAPIEMTLSQRTNVLQQAKNETLGFLYYIQTVCGHPEIGLALDEYPTADHLPFIPYVRECRRLVGLQTYRLPDVVDRYNTSSGPIYKTGISAGNYSIDHHHKKFHPDITNPYRTQGESYPSNQSVSIPYRCLIPKSFDGFMAVDKNISITHIVNGATRLQPIVTLTGQAAGAAAALSCQSAIQPRQVNIRQLQQVLLNYRSGIFPLSDISDSRWSFQEIQKICLSGVMRVTDNNSGWTKYTYFYPANTIIESDAASALATAFAFDSITTQIINPTGSSSLTRANLALLIWEQAGKPSPTVWTPYYNDISRTHSAYTAVQYIRQQGWTAGWATGSSFQPTTAATREILAVLIQRAFDPFTKLPLDSPSTTSVTTTLTVVWKKHLDSTATNWTSYPPSWFSSTTDNCRSMALNPVTGHLLMTDITANTVHILSGDNGSDLGTLNNYGIGSGVRSLMSLDIDSAGVIYACNYDQVNFTLYRWENESAPCTVAISTSLSIAAGRVMAVYGTGLSTKIYITVSNPTGSFMVLTTANNQNFQIAETVTLPGYIPGGYGLYGLTLAGNDVLYVKGITAGLVKYQKTGTTWSILTDFSTSTFSSTIISILKYLPNRSWLTGLAYGSYGPVSTSQDTTITSPGALIYSVSSTGINPLPAFAPIEETITNSNASGGIAYDSNRKRLYVLMPLNGFAAYDTTPIEPSAPVTAVPLWYELGNTW